MKTKLPETLVGLDAAALAQLREALLAESAELSALPDADITDEQLADLEQIGVSLEGIDAEAVNVETAATERAERIAAARAKVTPAPEEAAAEEEVVDEAAAVVDEAIEQIVEEVVVPDDASQIAEEEAVTASAGTKRQVIKRAAGAAPIVPPKEVKRPSAFLTASADVPEFAAGQQLEDFSTLTNAFINRTRGFKNLNPKKNNGLTLGVASMHVVPEDYAFSQANSEYGRDDQKLLTEVSKENRLENESLVAAGGWCAPSETIYALNGLESLAGLLSVPEIAITRGGINFAQSPDFGTFLSSGGSVSADAPGFTQTESQAESGTAKQIDTVACPSFTDVRLDAVGYGMTVPILTNVGYPEVIQRYLSMAAMAHQRKVNAYVITKIVGFLSAVTWGDLKSGTSNIISGIAWNAEILRQKYSLGLSQTIDGFAPNWLKEVIRADLANLQGVDKKAVSDAEIQSYFVVRNINLQWVRDWQPQTTATGFPTSVIVALYPAGSFVRGNADVISIDAIYDTAGVTVNEYTAVFYEQGILVANMLAGGVKVTIPLNVNGASGYPAVGAGSGISFAPAS